MPSPLTPTERRLVAHQALLYRPGFGYAFAHGKVYRDAIHDEAKICRLFIDSKAWRKKVAPEVTLAHHRSNLTPAGIQRALGDLIAYFGQKSYNYLNLLEENPHEIAAVIEADLDREGVITIR